MKIRIPETTCKMEKECDNSRPNVRLEVTKSMNVDKTNTLHQFDTAGIVGVQSPVGKIPIVFYVKETCNSGKRGILYYDDYDSVCYMFPEHEHAEWCKQPYDMKYDELIPWNNGVERGLRREHGIFELWVNTYRKWYNGQVMFRPKLKLQGCGGGFDGYPITDTEEVLDNVAEKKTQVFPAKKTKVNHSCGCRKG